ncbi:MAG TPA: discoidin domain-containing protein, partial [Candidatus Eremiobacteraceae bacterium]|nr:discoidin domain-containing protein [Candidatus Eremiobacteraceae bacterium]
MRIQISAAALFVISCFACGAEAIAADSSRAPAVGVVRLDANPSHRIQTITTIQTIGSTVDKEPAGTIPSLYSPQNIRAINAAGLGWLSYRLFTELSDQDWHWNPAGSFSAGDSGYWTSSASTASAPISDSFGYRLPHNGNSTDQGNNEGFSRLDDGDPHSYWKSDPYLTNAFTGDPDAQHAQWAVVDLGSARDVNAIRIRWADPYATSYWVGYWVGSDAMGDQGNGKWVRFPSGRVDHAIGGVRTSKLSGTPIAARFVRLVMTRSSNTCDTHGSADRRDCVGYAIDELSVGRMDAGGSFHDYVHHSTCSGERPGAFACGVPQTVTYVSSVDPWHGVSNRVRNQEQPGLDMIARSGLTRGIGAIYPVPMLYSTPANAAAEIRYLESRGYKIAAIELGEEPDGQFTTPEDDAALFVQWAKALHAVDPALRLGGPVFSGVNADLKAWPDAAGNTSWLNRFLNYLKAHGRADDLAFMSFEHYPFEGCEHGAALLHDLQIEPSIMKTVVSAWLADGVPATTPLYVTEAGFTWVNYAQTAMQIEGALWLADYMGSALADGVQRVVYYQDEPVPLSFNRRCPPDWGNLTMFVADSHAVIHARAAQFFGAQMIDRHWLAPGAVAQQIYPASTDVTVGGLPLITAYAARRTDDTWSIMLVNKDVRAHDVQVRFEGLADAAFEFVGDVTRVTFGSAQYVWRP